MSSSSFTAISVVAVAILSTSCQIDTTGIPTYEYYGIPKERANEMLTNRGELNEAGRAYLAGNRSPAASSQPGSGSMPGYRSMAVNSSGGSAVVPSTSSAQAYLEARVNNDSQGLLQLTSFHKSDGLASEVGGIKGYTLEATATITPVADCEWMGAPEFGSNRITFAAVPARSHNQTGDVFRSFALGESTQSVAKPFTVYLKFSYVKKESGWVLEDMCSARSGQAFR